MGAPDTSLPHPHDYSEHPPSLITESQKQDYHLKSPSQKAWTWHKYHSTQPADSVGFHQTESFGHLQNHFKFNDLQDNPKPTNTPNSSEAKAIVQQITHHGTTTKPIKTAGDGVERVIEDKLHDGSAHLDNLLRAYKHSPHSPSALALKYIVHRVNHLNDYADKGKGERLDKDFLALHQFGGAKKKNEHVKASDLHHILQSNPQLIDQAIENRTRTQGLIKRGVGLTTKVINGKDYVALTRGLDAPKMTHEHALSSFADLPHTGFGKHQHHTWVPLSDVWHAYDFGSRHPSSEFGPENEFLVSHQDTRHPATPLDVTPNRFKEWGRNFYDKDSRGGPLTHLHEKTGDAHMGRSHWSELRPLTPFESNAFAGKIDGTTEAEKEHQLMNHGFGKVMPGFKFPGLGIKDDRRETPIVTTPEQERSKNLAIYNTGLRAGIKVPNKAKYLAGGKTLGGSANLGTGTISYALANSMYPKGYNKSSTSDVATKLHEDFHNLFKRVQNKYGKEGRQNLAANLMAKLKFQDPQAHNALHRFFKQSNPTARVGKSVPLSDEEHFSTLLNYLNDKAYRNRIHKHFFGSTNLTGSNNRTARAFNNSMKRAYKLSLQNAMVAGKMDLLEVPVAKSELNKTLPAALAAIVLSGSALSAPKDHKWDPTGLPKEMHPIAQLESSGGIKMNHQPSPRGPFFTAYGALGYKPSTAYDEFKTSPKLQAKYPVKSPEEFYQHFTTNLNLYKDVAHQHWRKLMRLSNNNPVEAAFRWHWGVNKLASPEVLATDDYVKNYRRLSDVSRGVAQR